jgi:predicted MFS family arabinose efflux permease
MFTGMAYSIIAPLFPGIATKHNVNEDILGLLISIGALASFCAAPFVPKLISKFGRIDLLYFSTFGEATCVILYGFFNFIPSYYSFIIIGFSVRIIHGIFTGIVGILIYSLVSCISSEDEIQMALGNMEVAWCLGLSAGPLFASVFYKLGGYILPFIALGGSLYISVYLTKIISEEKINTEDEGEKNENEPSIFKSIFHISIILNLFTVTIGIIVTTFYFPCLTNHLTQNYNLSISASSLFFIVGMVFYMIFLRFLNAITDKFGMEKTPCLGLLMIIIGCLFVYPVEPIPQSIVSILIGLCLIGGSGAPINVPALINMSTYLKKYDPFLDELTANDIASTLYSLANNIGDFVGPTLGGFLSSKFGFKSCCVILSFLFFFYLIIYY